MCIATAVIYAGRQVRASVLQNGCVYAEHVLLCSVGAGVHLFLMEKELTVLSTKFWNVRNGRVWMTQRPLFQEALINTMRVSRGALCGLLQPPVAKLHQSCWPVSNNPWRWVFPLLAWNKYQIRHHTSALFCLLSFPVFPHLCSCILSFSLLFIPLQRSTPGVALDGAVTSRPHPVKRHWNVGRRKVRRLPGSSMQLPKETT